MAIYKEKFMSYMDSHGIKYAELDNDAVRVVFAGSNMNSIPVYVIFDKDGKNLVAFCS